jgi:hypothetical protein
MNLLISISGVKDVAAFEEQLVSKLGLIVAGQSLSEDVKLLTAAFKEGVEEEDIVNHDCPLCKKKKEAAATDGEIPPEEAADTPALNELDGDTLDDEDKDSGCGCGECAECKANKKFDENVDIEIKPKDATPIIIETGPVRVLTLATSHEIKSQYVLGRKKTTLSTSRLQVDEDRVRFKFNTFEHVLPIQLASHKATVVNEAHEFGTQTVRLVLSFGGKTFPTLVDLVEGEEDVLSIGSDLYEVVRKDRDDVSSK